MQEGAPSLSEALDAFLDDVAVRLAPLTHTTYERRLRPLRAQGWPLTKSGCRTLVADQVRAGLAPATIVTFVGALQSFARFCREQGWIFDDPTAHLSSPKIEHKPPRYLTEAQVDAIKLAAKPDELLAVILLATGVRAAELLSIRVEDIDDGLITIKGKGARYRYVPLPDEAIPLLPASGALFAWPYRTLLYRMNRLGKRADVPRLHPHLFRHTFASRGVQELDMTTVQIVGGWASQQMLVHYARSTIQRAAAQKARKLLQ